MTKQARKFADRINYTCSDAVIQDTIEKVRASDLSAQEKELLKEIAHFASLEVRGH